jgi:hypothetical protein
VCHATASAAFRNERKLCAIVNVARNVDEVGFAQLKKRITRDPLAELRRLPHIGHVTMWHLAKNLGFEVAKPDRHLERLSALAGYTSTHRLCRALSEVTGDAVNVVDLVLWRFVSSANEAVDYLHADAPGCLG